MTSSQLRDEYVESLQAEIQRLKDRIEILEELSFPTRQIEVPIEWGLTGSERKVFGHLVVSQMATKQSIMVALYSDRPDDEPEMKIVDVFICKMRKKLPADIKIETIWGHGYRLDKASRDRFKPRNSEAAPDGPKNMREVA